MALAQRYVEKDCYTEDEYLRWETDAAHKSEYVNEEIRAMSGGTDIHSILSVNFSALLWAALRGTDCRTMSSDMKVRTPRNTFRYPDVSVVCGERHYHGQGRSVITNPTVIVEVLSEGTEATDRGDKLREYQSLNSLQSYLLVSQDAPRIEQYARAQNGHWDYQAVEGVKNTITIPMLNVTLALSEIYDGVDFETGS